MKMHESTNAQRVTNISQDQAGQIKILTNIVVGLPRGKLESVRRRVRILE